MPAAPLNMRPNELCIVGESRAAWRKHRDAFIAELCRPNDGPLEQELVRQAVTSSWQRRRIAKWVAQVPGQPDSLKMFLMLSKADRSCQRQYQAAISQLSAMRRRKKPRAN